MPVFGHVADLNTAVELDISKLASGDLKKDLLALKVKKKMGGGGWGEGCGGGDFISFFFCLILMICF